MNHMFFGVISNFWEAPKFPNRNGLNLTSLEMTKETSIFGPHDSGSHNFLSKTYLATRLVPVDTASRQGAHVFFHMEFVTF